jgi:hypothetical protein
LVFSNQPEIVTRWERNTHAFCGFNNQEHNVFFFMRESEKRSRAVLSFMPIFFNASMPLTASVQANRGVG